MAKVMLVQPWSYHDEGVAGQDLTSQWRNGPYSLVLLGTVLQHHGHEVTIVDLLRDVVVMDGDVEAALHRLSGEILRFQPDIIGFGFYSIHYFEVQKAVRHARSVCKQAGLSPAFVAGNIHASTEPLRTLQELGFDYVFNGEAEISLVKFADGQDPRTIPGVIGPGDTDLEQTSEQVRNLDDLPFPDWALIDHRFYKTPSLGKVKLYKTSSLDSVMGRGCVYKCGFCAYNALSSVRFHSAEYLVEQVKYLLTNYGIDSLYFTDSTIGNNRKLMLAFADGLMREGLHKKVEWHANIRPNQVNEAVLKHIWKGGCRFLFYGFDAGSQRVLDLMVKDHTVEQNLAAAQLHERLRFPYHASIIMGYPEETAEDIARSLDFMRSITPSSLGVNCYVPLPGSLDYDRLKAEGRLDLDDPREWRRIGEVNESKIWADVEPDRYRALLAEAVRIANQEAPVKARKFWMREDFLTMLTKRSFFAFSGK